MAAESRTFQKPSTKGLTTKTANNVVKLSRRVWVRREQMIPNMKAEMETLKLDRASLIKEVRAKTAELKRLARAVKYQEVMIEAEESTIFELIEEEAD